MNRARLNRAIKGLTDSLSEKHRPEAELLGRFIQTGDQAAFECLVRRHGQMVLAVCRRMLGNEADAEDAFQAAFLILARKASSVRPADDLAGWLHGVACKTATHARRTDARRRLREARAASPSNAREPAADSGLREVIDLELARLPVKYRDVVILCDLEGMDRREAARRLGCPEGTVASRLARARARLAERLRGRGLDPSYSSVIVPAVVPFSVVDSTVDAACLLVVPEKATLLAEGVIKAMFLTKVKIAAILLLAVGLTAGVGMSVTVGMPPEVPAAQLQYATTRGADAKEESGKPSATAAKDGQDDPKTLRLDKDVARVVWSADGKLMASISLRSEQRKSDEVEQVDSFRTVKVWDAVTGKEIVSLGEMKNPGLIDVAFAPDGATIALSFFRQIEEGSKVELWDARRGALAKTIELDYGRIVPRFAFAPDGKTLGVLYAGDKGRDRKVAQIRGGVRLLDLADGKEIRMIRGHEHMAISLAFSPDGKLLATGGYTSDGDIRLWDVATGKELSRIAAGAGVPVMAFARSGMTLAAGLTDGRLVLYDVPTGKALRTLNGAAESISALAFSLDDRFLASAGKVMNDKKSTNRVQLWDLQTGQLLRSWNDTGASLAFSSDGKTLAILGTDAAVRLWQLKDLDLVKKPNAEFGFGKLIDQLIKEKNDDQAVEALYLATVGRYPVEPERKFAIDHLAKHKERREAMIDLVWTLINTKEFNARLDGLNDRDTRKQFKK